MPVSTISGGGTTIGGLAQQSNIQFKKVALQLEVVPLINSEKEVTLDILQKLDSLTGESTTVDGNFIPDDRNALHQDHRVGAELRHDCSGWFDPR